MTKGEINADREHLICEWLNVHRIEIAKQSGIMPFSKAMSEPNLLKTSQFPHLRCARKVKMQRGRHITIACASRLFCDNSATRLDGVGVATQLGRRVDTDFSSPSEPVLWPLAVGP